MAKTKHELTGHHVNDYGQVTETCSCGAAVDDHAAHVLDVARLTKRADAEQKERDEIMKGAQA